MSPEGDDQSLKKAPPVTASPIVPSPVLVAELPCVQEIVQEFVQETVTASPIVPSPVRVAELPCDQNIVQEIGKEVAELPCAISTTTNNHRACGY